MDENVTESLNVEEFGAVHQLGKTVVGGVAAFAAGKLADRLYDGAVRAYRARKSH